MNAKETAGCLAYFANAWPSATVTTEQVSIWAEQVAGIDPDDGRAAAKALVSSLDWFPTVAQFREACAAQTRRRIEDRPAIGAPQTPAQEMLEQNRRFSKIVRSILTEGHAPCEALGQPLCAECQRRAS